MGEGEPMRRATLENRTFPGLARHSVDLWLRDPLKVIEIEIGCAQGATLVHLSRLFPHHFFIGVEWISERCLGAEYEFVEQGIANAQVVNMEGYRFLKEYAPSSSTKRIHVYFPTPYPRSIDLRHRLVGPRFLEQAWRVFGTRWFDASPNRPSRLLRPGVGVCRR